MDIDQLIAEKGGIRLDVACGTQKQAGFVGLDMRDLPGVDIVWDVNCHPWPLPDACVQVAVASHIIEHIPPVAIERVGGDVKTWFPFLEFMDEVWRILKPGGQFAIACPHAWSPGYQQDPTHCNQVSEVTFAYFDPLEPNTGGALYRFYCPKPWRLTALTWSPDANIEVLLEKRPDDRSYHE